MLQDRDLLEAYRLGDPRALKRIYDEYVGAVERAATRGLRTPDSTTRVRVRSADQLADVVQEVFVRVFSPKTRVSYDGLRDFMGFLLVITRNVIADQFRKQPKQFALSDCSMVEQPEVDQPEPWIEPRLVRMTELYVASLPADLKAIHQSRFVEGMSQEDIAKHLGSTRQRVRTLEQKLRDGLRELLEKQDTLKSAICHPLNNAVAHE